jgi:hypothetical protein
MIIFAAIYRKGLTMNYLLEQIFCVEEEPGKYRVSLTKAGSVIRGAGALSLGAAGTLLASGYHITSVVLGGLGAALVGIGDAALGIGKRNAMTK